MKDKAQEGDIGTEIKLNLGNDITGATVKKIKYQKSNGTKGEWDANVMDTTYLVYYTQAGDLSPVGKMILQVFIDIPNWTGHGEKWEFEILPNINI